MVQWLRTLPRQGTQVRSLVGEDSTCHGATKPMHHNHFILEPALHNRRSYRNENPCITTREYSLFTATRESMSSKNDLAQLKEKKKKNISVPVSKTNGAKQHFSEQKERMGQVMAEQTEATMQNTLVLSRLHGRTEKNRQNLPTWHPTSPRRKLCFLFFWSLGSLFWTPSQPSLP